MRKKTVYKRETRHCLKVKLYGRKRNSPMLKRFLYTVSSGSISVPVDTNLQSVFKGAIMWMNNKKLHFPLYEHLKLLNVKLCIISWSTSLQSEGETYFFATETLYSKMGNFPLSKDLNSLYLTTELFTCSKSISNNTVKLSIVWNWNISTNTSGFYRYLRAKRYI